MLNIYILKIRIRKQKEICPNNDSFTVGFFKKFKITLIEISISEMLHLTED